MELDAAAHILFQKDYDKLTNRQAEEAHDFREQQEQMAHDEMVNSMYLDTPEWGDQ